MNWEFSRNFLARIKDFCAKLKIELKLEIITNGYLLDSEKINLLIKYGLCNIQITLDGSEDVHNSRRCLSNGAGTFNKIINNLDYLLKQNIECINLRINYDKQNISDMEVLMKYLSDKFSLYKEKITLSFGLIEDTKNNMINNIVIDNDKEFKNEYIRFYKLALQYSFKIAMFYETGSICMSKRKNSIIISPDKKLYKCLSMVGKEKCSVGDLNFKIIEVNNYLNLTEYEKCLNKKCEFIPMCHGGCRFKSFINNDVEKFDCQYNLLNIINKEILEILYI